MEEKTERTKKICFIIIPLLVALISATLLTQICTSARVQQPCVSQLDESRNAVLGMTAASAGASAAITLIPGDVATPIASKLADLSGYFLIILGAIYLEKYLFISMGYLGFRILIPLACVLFSLYFWRGREILKKVGIKLVVVTLALFFAVPLSTGLSNTIRNSGKDYSAQAIENAEKSSEELKASTAQSTDSDGNIIEQAFNTLTGGVKKVVEKFEKILGDFIDAVAIMLITSCVVPILVLIFLIWLLKNVAGVLPELPAPPNLGSKVYQKAIAKKGTSENQPEEPSP